MLSELFQRVSSGRSLFSKSPPERDATQRLKDECLDEATMMDEEFVVLTGLPLDSDYQSALAANEERFKAECEKLRVLEAGPIAPHLEEVRARLQRDRISARRRIFGEFVHRSGVKRAALCLSGGGIRSATFSLGVIQALASRRLLGQFHFLSTVSGGGYIGSWLSAWIHRHPGGLHQVQEDLSRGEPAELFRLREYSRYLAPRFGMVTSDTWTLINTYARNLLITWFALLPILVAVLALPRVLVAVIKANRDSLLEPWLVWAGLHDSADVGLLTTAYAAVLLMMWALGTMAVSLPGVARPHRALITTEAQFVTRSLVPLCFAGILLTVAWRVFADMPESMPMLSRWARWFTDQRLPDWLLMGGALHGLALVPAVGLRLIDEATIAFAQAEARSTTSLFESAVAVYRDTSGKVTYVGNELSTAIGRSVAAVVICGGLGGALMWGLASLIAPLLQRTTLGDIGVPLFVTLAPPGLWTGILVAGTVYVAAVSPWSSDHEREWYARAGAWILILISIWVALCSVTFFGPSLIALLRPRATVALSVAGAIGGILAVVRGRSSRGQPARRLDEPESWADIAMAWVTAITGPVFLILVLSVLSGLTTVTLAEFRAGRWDGWRYAFAMTNLPNGPQHLAELNSAILSHVLLLTLALLVVAFVIDRFVDLGVFSLHAMYRDRLIRAYLASSRRLRYPNAFTGFDADDNVALVQLRPGFFTHADAPQLANVLRVARFRRPSWSLRREERRSAERQSKEFVMDLLAEENLDTLMAIASTDRDQPLSSEQEEILIRRWNAVLVHADFCDRVAKRQSDAKLETADAKSRKVSAAHLSDPVMASRHFLCNLEWFSAAAHCPAQSRLFPVINTALNLMRGARLARDRKAEPFSLTPLHAGAPILGYSRLMWHNAQASVRYYAGRYGVSLGTAMTISGAAANPNMGYHSSPVITFLLALFNARLGMWIASPADRQVAERRSPAHSVPLVFREAFGVSGTDRGFVNLSDGGHFENLGVYEMVRRRCHVILVVDGGQDPECEFGDLGNAISKVRVDFNIPIEFVEPLPIPIRCRRSGDDTPPYSAHGAVAKIKYSAVDDNGEDGWLLYVKPALDGKEPVDILSYAEKDRLFPHQPTSNQFFSETQFESYRMLGVHSIEQIVGDNSALAALPACFEEHQLRHAVRKPGPVAATGASPDFE